MKIIDNPTVYKTVTAFLFILFVCAFDISAQPKISQGVFVKNDGDLLSRQRIINTRSGNSLNTSDLEKSAFELLNAQRAKNNLGSLRWSDEVAKIARIHSENMARHKFFNHRGIDGLMVDQRADLFGIRKWRAIGENIAFNQGYENPVEFAVERWMLSPTHRENILNSRWQESAVGVAIANDGAIFFTQVFLLRK